MSTPGTGISALRIGLIAQNTLREAIRQKLFGFLLFLALGMMASALFFRDFNFGSSELKFISDFGFGALTVFGSILAIVATAQLFFSEIENRTALTVLSKPVHRSEFILGKFSGLMIVLGLFTLLMLFSLWLVLHWRESSLMASFPEEFAGGRIVAYGGIGAFFFLQWLKFGILIGITMVIAGFSNTNLYTVVMSFFILIICHLQYLAREAWTEIPSWPMRWAVGLVGLIFPNFQVFHLGDAIALGMELPVILHVQIALYGFAYLVVFSGLAILVFSRREI